MKKLVLLLMIFCLSSYAAEHRHAEWTNEPTQNLAKDKLWLSIGADAVAKLNQKYSSEIQLVPLNQSATTQSEVAIIKLEGSKINLLSQLMHDDFHRCPGFVVHNSLAEAQEFIANTQNNLQRQASADYTINNPQVVNSLLSNFTASNMSATVDSLSQFNNRFYTSQSGVEAANWLKQHWQNISQSRDDISVELYQHSGWAQPSVIATIEGSSQPQQVVVVGGHLDSVNWTTSPNTGRAPGFDDNASGIAVVTETLLTLVSSNYRPAKTIKLMGYAAEEVGLYGSNEIASEFKNSGVNVVGVAQFDMTGFHGSPSADIVMITDHTNSAQNQFMTDLIDTYLDGVAYTNDTCGYGCSDHASWTAQGFPASFPFEATSAEYNRQIHTINDNTFDVEHAENFLKLSLVYLAELAKGQIGAVSPPSVSTLQFTQTQLEVAETESISVVISRSGDNSTAVSIDYATQDGSAVAGTDYQAVSGTLSWQAGDSSDKTIQIDTLAVDLDKSFELVLSNPQGTAELGASSLSVLIKDTSTVVPEEENQSSSSGGGAFGWLVLFFVLLVNRHR